jgi:hypothetical protein
MRVIYMEPGRPTKYKAEYAIQAKKLCSLGAIDTEIADFLNIDISTLYRWKNKHKGFCEAIKLGKEPANERAKLALYHRALGYSHPEDKILSVNGEVQVIPTVKHYPPDSTALIFFLRNRLPEEFRNDPEPNSEDKVKPLNITFAVAEPKSDLQITKGK